MSGEALQSTQASFSALTAIESWARARMVGEPARTARQLAHPQFHCGTPPPAPDPKILIRIVLLYRSPMSSPTHRLLEPNEFVEWLRKEGSQRYHDEHPVHVRMHEGKLDRE